MTAVLGKIALGVGAVYVGGSVLWFLSQKPWTPHLYAVDANGQPLSGPDGGPVLAHPPRPATASDYKRAASEALLWPLALVVHPK